MNVELACQCVKFIVECFSCSNSFVKHVARQRVYFQKLHSSIGRNAHHGLFVSTVDHASLSGISGNAGRLSRAWYAHNDAWMTDSDRAKIDTYC